MSITNTSVAFPGMPAVRAALGAVAELRRDREDHPGADRTPSSPLSQPLMTAPVPMLNVVGSPCRVAEVLVERLLAVEDLAEVADRDVWPFFTRGPVPLISCTWRSSSVGSGAPVKSKPGMTPFLNFGWASSPGPATARPRGLSVHLGRPGRRCTRTVSLLPMPSWELPVSPKASSADAVTASREPTLASRMPARNSRQLVVDREQLGALLVVGAERLLLGSRCRSTGAPARRPGPQPAPSPSVMVSVSTLPASIEPFHFTSGAGRPHRRS